MAQDSELTQAIKQICEEKNVPYDSVIKTIEAALAVAFRKDFGEKNQNIRVEFNTETGGSKIFDIKEVIDDEIVKEALERKEKKEKGEEVEEEKEEEGQIKYDPKKHIALSEAQKIKKEAKIGDEIKTELFPPASYGRMAAQTAKQVIIQRLREAERETLYKEYKGKEGEIINGIVQRIEGRMVLVDLGHTTALLPPPEQVVNERYNPGSRIKIYLVSVNETSKGPEIIVSRSHPEMVRRLFTLEVPEISSGSVEIKSIAREAGSRTKIAVASNQRSIDPVGSCVGQRGTRVQTIISELGGEKVDIVEYSENPVKFITFALSPAKILNIKVNEEDKTAIAEVKEDQLSLAIGKTGQNVRLAAKLTGWRIDIVGEGQEKRVKDVKHAEAVKDGESSQDIKTAENVGRVEKEKEAKVTASVKTTEVAESAKVVENVEKKEGKKRIKKAEKNGEEIKEEKDKKAEVAKKEDK
jgi:N utilization substance protein A